VGTHSVVGRVAVGGKERFACVDGSGLPRTGTPRSGTDLRCSTKYVSPRPGMSNRPEPRWPAPGGCFAAESRSTRSFSVPGSSDRAGAAPRGSAEWELRSRRRLDPDTTWSKCWGPESLSAPPQSPVHRLDRSCAARATQSTRESAALVSRRQGASQHAT
jgi:hypothetical protein